MGKIVFLLVLFSSSLLSQSAITIYSGVNYPSRSFSVEDESEYLNDHWMIGLNLGIDAEYRMASWFSISPVVEYNHYQFNTYDKSKVVLTDDVKSSSGKNSHIARFMIEAKIIDQDRDVADVYISIGYGYVMEKIGSINVTSIEYGGSAYTQTLRYNEKNYWVNTVGLGYRYYVTSRSGLDFCIKYYSNYTDRFHVSMNLGYAYRCSNSGR